MAISSALLFLHLHRCRPVSSAGTLIFLRRMGSGPRTFPDGVNKWKHRRMRERLERERERRLLDHKKQLYYARIRSDTPHLCASSSPKERLLVDCFVKDGAEDLWNDDDGPSSSSSNSNTIRKTFQERGEAKKGRKLFPEDESTSKAWNQVESLYKNPYHVDRSHSPGKLGSGRQNVIDGGCQGSFRQIEPFHQRRGYSVRAGWVQKSGSRFHPKKECVSESESDGSCSDYSPERFRGSSEGEGRESTLAGGRVSKRKMRGVHESMKGRKVSFHWVEKISSLQEVQRIREELKERQVSGGKDPISKSRENDPKDRVEEELVFSQKRFDEYNISPSTIKALSSAGVASMTAVEEAMIPIFLDGKDALVKVKPGGGNIAAYLLSAIETVLKVTTNSANRRTPSNPIIALIICPTGDLARQIASEANSLLKYHSTIGVQTLIGGTCLKVEKKCLESKLSQIVVATPGRLLDHLAGKDGLSKRLRGLKVMVIDEADHLLRLEFGSDLEEIMNFVPRVRQTLLFSSAITNEIRWLSQLVLKWDRAFVDTVDLEGERSSKVVQTYILACNEKHFEIIYHLLNEHVSQELEYKVVIFCTTILMTEVVSSFLRIMKMNARELHSGHRLSYRSRVSEVFRNEKRLILVTSDTLAQERQNQNVTFVLQIGVPPGCNEYINRLRVVESEARLGKCISVIAPFEEPLVSKRMDLYVKKSPAPNIYSGIKIKVAMAMQEVSISSREAAYFAWLKFYSSLPEVRKHGTSLANAANKFCASLGLKEPPPLAVRTAIKRGLVDIPGIPTKA